MNRTHRLIHNAVFSVGGWGVPIVLSFLFTPYIVRTLGSDSYGILTLVWSVIGYFAFLDLGLGRALVKFVSEFVGRKDLQGVNDAIGASILLGASLSLAGAIVIFTASDFMATRLLKIPEEFQRVACITFRLGALGFVAAMMKTIFQAIPRGLNRYDVTEVTNVVTRAISAIGAALLLFLGGGLIHIVTLYITMPMLASLVYIVAAKRLLPSIRFRPRSTARVFSKVLHFGLFAVLSRVAYVVVRNVDRLVIGAVIGVSSVTYYAVPLLIVGRISSLTQRIGNVIFPAVSELQGEHRQAAIVDLYLTAARLMTALATAICLPLVIFGSRMVGLWMTPEFATQVGAVIVLVSLSVYVDCLTNIPAFVTDGLGHPKVTGLSSLAHAILFVLLMVPLAHTNGIVGVALAGLIANGVVGTVFVWHVTTRILGIPFWRFVLESLMKPVCVGLLLFPMLRLIPQGNVVNLLVLLAIMGCTTLLYFGLCIPTGILAERERRAMLEYVKLIQSNIMGQPS